jgi:uncharacterized membrane protein
MCKMTLFHDDYYLVLQNKPLIIYNALFRYNCRKHNVNTIAKTINNNNNINNNKFIYQMIRTTIMILFNIYAWYILVYCI